MNKEREFTELLRDSGATVLVTLQSLYRDVASKVLTDGAVRVVLTTSELDLQSRNDERAFAGVERIECDATIDLLEFLETHSGATPPGGYTGFRRHRVPDLHLRFDGSAEGRDDHPRQRGVQRAEIGIGADDVVLGVAPLFHITGLVGHIAISLLSGAPSVLMYRLDPALTLDTLEAEGATFTVGSITVFIGLMNAPNAERAKLATLSKIYSGGAPIPPSTVQAFESAFGHYIHNIYGLTETTSPSHGVPFHAKAPVDPASGALSVGVPIYNTIVRIIDDDGKDLPAGEVGELVTAGPQVVNGYWNKPDESARAFPDGALHTGDVGYMDEAGWFYIVDRKKDQINAGGYKIRPREVDDVLYEHPDVREAAIVGVPDEYRGETVKAFVSMKANASATPEDIIAFVKERIAAYKYPRSVVILDEIPRTVSGKILRRELRTRG